MLKDVTNIVGSAMPNASLVCYAAGIFAGRKFCIAFTCKVGSVVANILGIQEMTQACNDLSIHYWTQAKKDGFRDILAVVGLIALGFAASHSGEILMGENGKQNKTYFSDKSKESSKTGNSSQDIYWHYPKKIIDTLVEYPKTTLTMISAPILGITWKFSDILSKRCHEKLIDNEFFLNRKFLNIRDHDITNPFRAPLTLSDKGKMHVYKILGDKLRCIANCIQKNNYNDYTDWAFEPKQYCDV